jgi:hypothetical protein
MVESNTIRKFELVLARDGAEDHQYEPGEKLRGEIVLVIAGIAPLKADSIWVELRGEAQVSWQQKDDEDRNQHQHQHQHQHDDEGEYRVVDSRRRQRRATGQRQRLGNADVEQQPASRGIRSSSTSYTLQHNHQNGSRHLCTAVETYIDERRTVWAATAENESTAAEPEVDPRLSAQASAAGAIAPGEYRYPFEFQLPSDLPSSFRGQYGSVGYAVRAVVMMSPTSVGRHRLAGGRAAVVSEPFFIKRRLKQQLQPSSPSTDAVDGVVARQRKPADGFVRQRRERQSLTSDDCSTTASSDADDPDGQMLVSGASVAVVEVLKSGSSSPSTPRLLLGPCCFGAVDVSRIRAEFAVLNGSECRLGGDFRVDIRVSDAVGKFRRRPSASEPDAISIEASLVQLCTFMASHGRRRRTVALVSRRTENGGNHIGDRSLTRRWADLRLSVPTNLPESGLPGCNIIDVSYELRFSVEVIIVTSAAATMRNEVES